ncbi:hypothetical protein CFOL_v3_27644 [Cephalotus follicularis]|uniref:THO1-MOS11 C-terminal domain-containing protein n=1 Tax=Cephalotus follicularis TaxID=3775 RepID=A0A1Q3CVE7_CEPFO|nr:hypothetical protein CFOL_v3_27644 [Cephalotus follicularis]
MATATENLATTKTTTATNPNPNPNPSPIDATSHKTLDLTKSDLTAIDSEKDGSLKDGEDSKITVTTIVYDADNNTNKDDSGSVSNIQKKIRRAERFGMPVKLSEEEKRNSRAERFGTAAKTHVSDTPNNAEELKRKARAERFGLSVQPVASDEETKRKARLARFSPYPKTDSLEEDKRKARADRFSKPQSSSVSQVNGKGNIEPKAAIAGKAGGGT